MNTNQAFFLSFFLSSPHQSATWQLDLSSWTGMSLSMDRTPNATLWSLCCAASLAALQWGPPWSALASTVCLLVSDTKRQSVAKPKHCLSQPVPQWNHLHRYRVQSGPHQESGQHLPEECGPDRKGGGSPGLPLRPSVCLISPLKAMLFESSCAHILSNCIKTAKINKILKQAKHILTTVDCSGAS